MAGVGPAPLDFTRSRHGKPLRRTPMCFYLWHPITPVVKNTEPSVGSGTLNTADPGMTIIAIIPLSRIPFFISLVK
jgi:hypothetical protein